jgi:hypothetical protein
MYEISILNAIRQSKLQVKANTNWSHMHVVTCHMSPLAEDTKLLVCPQCNSAGLNKRAEGARLVVRNLWAADPPPGAHTASHRVSLHLAALRVFCYHFWDKSKVNSSTALLTYQQAERLRWYRGSALAFGTEVRGFAPGRSRRIFRAKKSSARLPSEGK